MGYFVLILIIGIILLFVFRKLIKGKQKRRLINEDVPAYLGLHLTEGRPIVKALDAAFPTVFKSNVKRRLLEEHVHWTENDYQWRFFELKRFFVMNGLLKSVPMFSEEVDKVWHEMLMFTKDYEKFSQKFYGEFLHHIPTMESEPMPGERAFFDWVYLSLFELRKNSNVLWEGFLKYPIKEEILHDFKELSEEMLLQKYFRHTTDWHEIKIYLINKLKSEIKQAEEYQLEDKSFSQVKSHNEFHLVLPAAVYFSLYEVENYDDMMGDLNPFYSDKASSSFFGFGCTAGDGSSCSSCGSSCSSCGGGCSS